MAKTAQKMRGAQLRSRQRAKAMGVALGAAMLLTLGLLSLVNTSPGVTTPNDVGGHVTRHLRELLLDQSARGRAVAMETQGHHPVSMEAQGRHVTKSRGAAMEAQGRVVGVTVTIPPTSAPDTSTRSHPAAAAMEAQGRVVGVTVTIPPTSAPDTSTRSHPPAAAMEAQGRVVGVTVTIPPTSAPDTSTRSHPAAAAMEARLFQQEKRENDNFDTAEVKAEVAEEIAKEALAAALRAQAYAQAAEAEAEISIFTHASRLIGQNGE